LTGRPRMKLGSSIGLRAALIVVAWSLLLPPTAAFALDDWATVLANAKKEGVVVVHGAPGKGYNHVLVGAFNKAHPDIKVQFSGANSSVEIPKVLRERQAGMFNWDVWVSGPTGALGTLKQAGFFQPLRPILRPEVTADDKWIGGFAAGWMDNGHSLFYAFDGTAQNPVKVNWDVVPRASFTSLADLTKPEFAGKIVMHDPRVSGTGNGSSQTLFHTLGEAGLVKLYKNQVVYTLNGHQVAEWVVRGRYPIGIGLEPNDLNDFQSQGIGTNISPVPDSFFKIQQISVGFGGVGLVDRAPHINAATVYINWLLSEEAQKAWVKLPRGTRHTGVTSEFPDLMPKEGGNYFFGQAENYTAERKRLVKVAREAIDGDIPRSGKSQ
jgi:iron(III) transport system substrate-binding protein